MFHSILALLFRSLRLDVRSRGAHLARMALCIAIYLSMLQYQVMAAWAGAPGLDFFRSILFLNSTFLTLFGIGVFSSPISEEKEEDSLGLLRMAGVDSLGLLIGKSGGRVIQATALLIVQFPFTMLSITLGGVTYEQIFSAYVAMAAYLLMLAGMGVLLSTVSRTTRSASRLMLIFLALYIVVPWLCLLWVADMAANGGTSPLLPVAGAVSKMCIFLETTSFLSTNYAQSFLTVQVVSNVAAGFVAFLVAWLLFDVCTRNASSEAISRGPVATGGKGYRFSKPGRPIDNSLIWKDFHFVAGGVIGLIMRTLFYLTLFAVIAIFFTGLDQLQAICLVFMSCQAIVLPIDASLLVARSMQDEVRGQTIPSLVMLPRSIPSIVYSKLAGALVGLIPGLVCFAIALICTSDLMISWFDTEIRFDVLVMIGSGVLYMVLLPHLTAVIALVVRWGATPIAVGALYAVQLTESMLMIPLFLFSPMVGNGIGIFMGITALCNLSLCVGCHFEMLRRFRKLAEK